ncbi:PBSX family phage terminase large subunit [Oceanobacillus indicireducens]|uniref:Terminase, large subunit - phage associated n=1 Tax=Oceanobacillus indicireducens TaxID=1004261 RepID=A0A918D456_9BACI|nr:PBSX family phage terminase large subunit [Oceanobacillus indicireducens]GGN64340.1 putative terminase, large subunit - phage associated [Oceanobacillus indicireducens]
MTTKKQPIISPAKTIGKGYNRFWHNKQFYRVVKGSRGSKKSKNTALNYIYRIMKYEWANLLVIRRYSNTNKQSTYTDLKWAANKLKVAHLFKFNESMPEITYLPTGQKILFRGLDDPLKITSISVDVGILCWVWCEEAYQLEDMGAFDTVVESIRGSHDSPDFFKQVTLTFNPWSERHWLKREFFDEETKRKDVFAITTTFRVNEWLDEVDRARYQDLYRTNPRRARIVADGEWGVAEGLVFENFEVREFDPLEKIKQIQETTHGMDYGFTNDPTTEVSSVVDLKNKEIWIYDEHYEKGMTTQDIYNILQEKELLKASITGDSAEPRLIRELVSKGVRRLHASVKGKGSINHGISFLQGFKIYIHPSCEHTIEEFNTYTFKQDKEGKWLNEPIDANNHIIDALRYSMERYHMSKGKDKKQTYKALQSLGL